MKKSVELNRDAKIIVLLLVSFVLIGSYFVFAYNSSFSGGNPEIVGHQSAQILFENGCSVGPSLQGSLSKVYGFGDSGLATHYASEIDLLVDGEIKTLRDVVMDVNEGSSAELRGHSADEVNIEVNGVVKSLQQAYLDGDLSGLVINGGGDAAKWDSVNSASFLDGTTLTATNFATLETRNGVFNGPGAEPRLNGEITYPSRTYLQNEPIFHSIKFDREVSKVRLIVYDHGPTSGSYPTVISYGQDFEIVTSHGPSPEVNGNDIYVGGDNVDYTLEFSNTNEISFVVTNLKQHDGIAYQVVIPCELCSEPVMKTARSYWNSGDSVCTHTLINGAPTANPQGVLNSATAESPSSSDCGSFNYVDIGQETETTSHRATWQSGDHSCYFECPVNYALVTVFSENPSGSSDCNNFQCRYIGEGGDLRTVTSSWRSGDHSCVYSCPVGYGLRKFNSEAPSGSSDCNSFGSGCQEVTICG